jgi:hypothetical protein
MLMASRNRKGNGKMKYKKLRSQLEDHGYEPETIDKIIDFYTR